MKKNTLLLIVATLLSALACNIQEDPAPDKAEMVTFKAVMCDIPSTKTVLQSDGSVFWSPGDAINLFYGETVAAQFTSDNTEPVAQTNFNGTLDDFVPNGSDEFWAVYPYVADNSFDGSAVTLTLPATQEGVSGTFAKDLYISMARSKDYTLQFYNLCGGVKFCVVNEGIQYVTFRGNAQEVLAGTVKVAFDANGKPQVQEVLDGETEIRLDAPGGTFEVGKWYYLVALPATLSAGYTLSFYKDELFAQHITDTQVSVKRAIWGKLTDADKEPDPEPVELKNIQCQGWTASFDENTDTFTLTIPTETQFTNLVLTYEYDGTTVKVGETTLVSGETQLDASAASGSRDGEHIVTLLCDGWKEYTLVLRNTGLPVVTVITADGKPANQAITSKETWVGNVTLRLDAANGDNIFKTDPKKESGKNQYCQMKGRGNTTWEWFDKKPYAIKLEKKAGLVDGEEGKRWILLANFKDRTLLRNDAAFWLSKKSGLAYTVRGMFVELLFNGEYRGNYYLCEQIKIGKNRVNITEMDKNEDGSTNPINITGGFLMEADIHNDEGANAFKINDDSHWGWSNSSYYYNIKEPDTDETTDAARNYVKGFLQTLESSLSDNTNHSYENYLDVDSAIDFLLMQELTSNDDFYNGGVHSTYLYKDRNKMENEQEVISKVYLGPIWDFDYSTFLPSRANFWSAKEGNNFIFYYKDLLNDSKFRSRLVERWNERKNQYKDLPAYIDSMAEYIRLSEQYNHQLWPQAGVNHGNENGEANMTFDEAVANIKSGFLAKWEWIDQHISNIQ